MSDYKVAIKIAGQLESSFNSAIKGAQSGLSGLGVAGKVGSLALKATAATITAAGTAIAAVGTYAVKTGSDFESAMSSAAATANATEEEYAKLEAAAMEMGRTTSKTASESANALEYMALAGWDVDTSISALPSVLKMSEASGMDLARTSDLVTDSMSALGVTVDELPNYLDVAAKAQTKSNQTAEQLMEAYLGVGGTMNNLNVPIEESATALGVLANRGIKGSEAGTALNAIMVNLTTGTGKAGKAMESLGISAFDSEGNFIGLEETLKQVNTALQNCTEEERNTYLAALGGKTHVDALNDLMAGLNTTNEEGVSEWAALTSELENCNGALETMRNTKLDNLEGDLAVLKSAAQDAGIKIYKNLQTPLRGLAQYGTSAIYELSDALEEGGFEGMVSKLGDVLGNGLSKMAEYAPQFIDMATNLVDSLITGIDNNESKITPAIGRLGTALVNAFIKLAPRIITTGAKLLVMLAKGILDNLPEIQAAGKEAISYLMNAAKNALKSYLGFLDDDAVAPFKKIVALIPAVVAGFLAFRSISGVVKTVSSFISTIKGVGKAGSIAKKGLGGMGGTMSSLSKNILGAGVGFAAAAAGIWLLVDAAKSLADAGPGAAVALTLMAVGIAAFMVLAAAMGPELQASKEGLIAFGAAILMAAAGMALMSFAAVQLAQAGPSAIVALALMEVGIAGFLAIAGAMGPELAAAAPGLIAFGVAILLAAAGMALLSYSAMQLASAGPTAIATLVGMAAGIVIFMAVAAVLGTALTAAAVGLLAFGAAIILAAAGMYIMVQAAIAISSAGPGAQIALALLAVGIIAFAAVAGLLAPLLLAGAAALAAFGAALLVVGAALVVVAAAAVLGAAAVAIIAAVLPQLATYGASGAAAITLLGASLVIFAAGAALAGVSVGIAAVAMAAFAVAALAAAVPTAALAVEMVAIGAAIAIMAASGATAASSLEVIKSASSGMITSMAKLATSLVAPTAALVPFAAAALAASVPTAVLAAALVLTLATLTALLVVISATTGMMTLLNTSMTLFRTSSVLMGAAVTLIIIAFNRLNSGITPAITAMTSLSGPVLAVSTGMTTLATSLMSANSTFIQMRGSIDGVKTSFTALVAIISSGSGISAGVKTMGSAVKSGMSSVATAMTSGMKQVSTRVMSGMNNAKSATVSGMAAIVAVTSSGIILIVTAVRSGSTQAVAVAQSGASSIQSAFTSINLYSAGVYMMQGLMNGMNSMKSRIEQTARDIANTASNAVNNALKVSSPSKVMTETGKWTGQGLVIGLQAQSGQVKNAATAALAQPIQDTSEDIRSTDMSVNSGNNYRSSVLNDELVNTNNNTGTNNNNDSGTPGATFVFSPTYNIEGDGVTKEDVQEVNKMSQTEFESMLNEWIRKNKRVSFA